MFHIFLMSIMQVLRASEIIRPETSTKNCTCDKEAYDIYYKNAKPLVPRGRYCAGLVEKLAFYSGAMVPRRVMDYAAEISAVRPQSCKKTRTGR